MGQQLLAGGERVAMRYWKDHETGREPKRPRTRPYETVGLVLEGKAELILDCETVTLEPGDSWIVPAQARHTYRILEPFTAVEATSPPARD
jgi:quercetin dioxygenase-like cupin family protein